MIAPSFPPYMLHSFKLSPFFSHDPLPLLDPISLFYNIVSHISSLPISYRHAGAVLLPRVSLLLSSTHHDTVDGGYLLQIIPPQMKEETKELHLFRCHNGRTFDVYRSNLK